MGNKPAQISPSRFRVMVLLLLVILLVFLLGFAVLIFRYSTNIDEIGYGDVPTVKAIYATNTAVRLLIDATQTAGAAQTQTATKP